MIEFMYPKFPEDMENGVIQKNETIDPVSEGRIVMEFIETLYKLDTFETRQDLFDWIISRTDELFSNDCFEMCNLIFTQVEVLRLSASAITALLRSTFVAKNLLPARTAFMDNSLVIEKLSVFRADAKNMLQSLR